ncbi:MAG: Putative ATPase involved in DNA repair [Desulfonauticus sp. 38_4375]|nr:MAG: Putative ATPase involved in DNA repair [Desulfonauticus sp. 38_4375]
MKTYPRGSEWRKWDLHVHTPIDHEWRNKPKIDFTKQLEEIKSDLEKFADEFIGFAEQEKLSVLAIVDHNFCNDLEKCYLPYIIKEANKVNITILPGFEITVKDGSGIHLLVIFKENTNLNTIQDIVKQCFDPGIELIPANGQVPISNKSIDELKKLLDSSNLEYILIFAHADRENGVLDKNTISGGRRVQEWKKSFINIAQLSKSINEFNENSFIFKVIKKKDLNYARDITCIISSDCRTINKQETNEGRTYLGEKFVWIKADPTFEGLKQIIYEPEDRVKIQEEKPEQKEPYNLIDYVQFIDSNENFTNEKIYLNQNLNVIIGGKSTGKSILLREIARTINPYEVKNRLEEANLKDYKIYEDGRTLTDDFIVRWIDEREDKRSNIIDDYRKIIYIPQSYLNRLVEKDEEQSPIDRLIENILKNDENIKHLFESVDSQINENDRYISNEINELIQNLQQSSLKLEEIKNLGDKKGIEKYIDNIKKEIQGLHKKGGLTEEEISQFSIIKENIEKLNNEIKDLSKQKIDYNELLNTKKFEKSYRFNQIVEKYKNLEDKATYLINKIEDEFNKYLQEEIEKIENFIIEKNSELTKLNKQIEPLLEKVKNIEILKNKNELLSEQEEKLKQIKEKETEKEKLVEKIEESINKLVDYFIKFYEIKSEFTKKIEQNNSLGDDLDLKIKVNPKNEKFNEEFINEVFDIRSLPDNLKDFNLNIEDIHNLKLKIRNLIYDVLNGDIKLKKQYSKNITQILQKLIKDWFVINYSIIYDGDNISDMSQGKKSFVLLRLIIELDKSKCPLLIDQPEDDLDNRSIYNEIVKFLREKKKERQIIIITHNANLAVSTDAECIIVANQDGEKTKNKKFKFEYVQGSLENTFINNEKEEILLKQGIKEHVCEILEGGEQAFEKRKNKYNFK